MGHLDIKIGKYTLVSKVGDGGMAEVFKARVVGPGHFEKTVALKKILPNLASNEKFRRSFIDEARICGQLHHHNIVEVYNFHEEGKDLYLAMEFIDGLNLEDVLEFHRALERPLTTDVVMSIMVQVLEGLEYAHTARSLDNQPLNVIHRDLKPSNILIDSEGVVKIVDFGVAKAANRRYETQEMTAKGTASYMAPEQLLGDRPVTQASDIFSIGTMFYEMLTLERLFDGEHVFAILKQVATMEINEHLDKTLTGADRRFLPLLRRALARDLGERYTSAAAMLRDLLGLHIVGHSPRRLADHLREIRNTDESMEDAATRLVTNTDHDDDDEEDLEDQVTRMAGPSPLLAAANQDPLLTMDPVSMPTSPLTPPRGQQPRTAQAAPAGAPVNGVEKGASSAPSVAGSPASSPVSSSAPAPTAPAPTAPAPTARPAEARPGPLEASSRPPSSQSVPVAPPATPASEVPPAPAVSRQAAPASHATGMPSILSHEAPATPPTAAPQLPAPVAEPPASSSGHTTPSKVFQMRPPPEPPTSMLFSILIGAGVGVLILLLLIYFS